MGDLEQEQSDRGEAPQKLAEIAVKITEMLRAMEAQLRAMEAQTSTNKVVGDCVLENTQIVSTLAERLKDDRAIDHRRLNDAVQLLESAAKKLNVAADEHVEQGKENEKQIAEIYHQISMIAVGVEQARDEAASAKKEAAYARRNSYDAVVQTEALSGQLEQPLKAMAESQAESLTHTKKVSSRVDDMTGQFETFKANALGKAEEKGKTPSEKVQAYWLVVKAFAELPLSTRILSTIIFGLLVAAFIAYVIEKGGK